MMSQSTATMHTTNDPVLQSPSSIEVNALPQQYSQQLNDDDVDNNEEKEQDENDSEKEEVEASHSPLDNDNTNNTTITMICKPQSNQFVNEMQFNFASIKSLLLTGRIDIGSEDNNGQALLCTPGRPAALTTEEVAKDIVKVTEEEEKISEEYPSVSKATSLIEECKEEEKEDEQSGVDYDTQSITSRRGPISLLFMLYNYISIHLLDLFGSTKSSKKKNNKSSNQLRIEERIRRELALEKKKEVSDEPSSVGILMEEAASTPVVPKDTTNNTITAVEVDESYLPSLVGPTEMISGKVHQEIQLIIQVDDIKFTRHPELSSSTVKEDTSTNNVDIASQRYGEEYQTTHIESKEDDADIETTNKINKNDKLQQQRRITSERYFVSLIINNNVVGDTKANQLDKSTFIVKLSHKFNCRLTSHKPTSVCLQIWKKSSIGLFFLPDCLIGTCFVPIEEQDEEEEDGLSLNVQFSSSTTTSGGNELQQGLKGTLSITSSCQVRSVQSGPATCKAPPQQLPTSMFRQSLIRPPVTKDDEHDNNNNNNNEKTNNSDLYHNHRQSTTMEFKGSNSGISFSNTSLIKEPLRHVLIKQRQRNPSSVPLSIPLTEREVQSNEVYHDLIQNEQEILEGTITSSIVQYDRISCRVKQQHLLEVYNGIKEYTQQTRRKKHHQSDIIHDVGLSRFFVNNEQFQLPSTRSRQVPTTANDNGRCSLLLTIVGGENVPIQLDDNKKRSSQHLLPKNHDSGESQLNEPANDKNDDEEERYLGVLVKIKFRGKTYQTKAVVDSGSMGPQWKETICLPLNDILEGGGNSSTHVEDEVVDLSLFDCTAIDLRLMGGFYEDEDTRSTELRYLVSVVFFYTCTHLVHFGFLIFVFSQYTSGSRIFAT